MLQAGMFLILAPFAGFEFSSTAWPLLLSSMALASLGLTAFGFLMAWALDNVQAYHAIQMTVLVPLWVVSGAMFPPDPSSTFFSGLMALNPISYAVVAVRHAFYSAGAPVSTVLDVSPTFAVIVLAAFAGLSLVAAIVLCERRR